jgi:hypothetical protein
MVDERLILTARWTADFLVEKDLANKKRINGGSSAVYGYDFDFPFFLMMNFAKGLAIAFSAFTLQRCKLENNKHILTLIMRSIIRLSRVFFQFKIDAVSKTATRMRENNA